MANILQGLDAAMFNTPSDYIEARDKYKTDLQYKINDTWWMASDNFKIQIENVMGSRVFTDIICRVNHAIEPKTGLNLGDDFKELKFFDLDSPITMGYRFQFDDSWWIVTNTDNYHYVTKSVIVRRCNNVIKYYRNGNLIEEPCIIDYAMKYSNVYFNSVVDVAQGTIEVICQNNENTQPIEYNDRFIFGKEVYKVKTVSDFLRQKTFVKESNPLIKLSMYVDTKAPDDDFVNGIAGIGQYNKNDNVEPVPPVGDEIVISPTTNNILIGETINYNCMLYKNGKQTSDEFTFEVSGVPNEYYDFDVIDGNNFSITNIMPYFAGLLKVVCKTQASETTKELLFALKGLY